MATNFPTSLDNLSNPAGSDPVNNPSHAVQHANVNDAIEALETKVGVNNSAVTTSLDYRVKQLETNPTYTNEMAQDAVAAALAAGTHTNITINYNDTGNSISISAAAGYTNEEAVDAVAAALTAGSGISISYNDPANTITISVDSTIATKTYVDTAITSLGNTAATTYVPQSDVGNIDGVASLDGTGKVPDSQIPAGIARDSEVTSAISTEVTNRNSAISTAINNLINSAPGTLDTLGEIATQLAADESAAAALTTVVNGKVSKAGGDVITSSLPSIVGLTVKGAASQTANLQEWQNNSGTVLSSIDSTGSLNLAAGKQVIFNNGLGTRINLGYGAAYQLGIDDYTIAIESDNSSNIGKVAIRPSSATYGISYTNPIELYANGQIKQNLTLAANVGLTIKAATSQTANLQEWQNSAGTALFVIDSSGSPTGKTSGFMYRSFNEDSKTLKYTTWWNGASDQWGIGQINQEVYMAAISTAGSRRIGFYLQSPDLGIGSLATNGNMYIFQTGVGINTPESAINSQLMVTTSTASKIGLIVKGAASQTANLQEWQNSAGTILARITSGGVIGTTQNVYANRYYYSSNGTETGTSISFIDGANGGGLNIRNIDLGTPNASFDNVVPLTISGNINQTANLQNWKNAAGTVLAKVDSTGAMFTITPADSTNSTQVATTAYVKSNINNLINSAPGALDTLNELAAALGNDANFSTTITNSLALKAPLASPTFTGTPIAPTATSGTNTTQIATTAFVKTAIDSSVQPGALYQTSAPTSPAVGQIWIDSDDDVTVFDSNIIRRKSFTATAGQTVFVTDIPFIDGFEQVFMNGLLLVKTTDYTVSGGNTVTLSSGAAVSDIIEVVSVTGANSVTTYTQAEVDALIANNKAVSPQAISANTTLVKKKRYYVTSGSALTLTLPASPSLDDEIQVVDASGNASTYNITVARNGSLINGGTGNLIIDTNGGWYTLIYTGSTYGWKVG